MHRRTALITGASGGIGQALAMRFAADRHDVVLHGRDEGALADLAGRIAQEFGVRARGLPGDLAARGAGALLAERALGLGNVDVLVNNAGLGFASAFNRSAPGEQLAMIDVNVRALVELTHALWPAMLERGSGGVLNVASTSAFQPGPMMAVYFASKAFVLSFSEALWEEARGTGVHVSCLCPGPTASKFRARAGTDRTRNARTPVMSAEECAAIGCDGFAANRRVVIPGARNRRQIALARLMPRPVVLKALREALALRG